MGEAAPPRGRGFVQRRLSALSKSLGDRPYLDGDRFTAGDLMMTTVLRILKHTDIVTSDERLAAYVERCTARPAFKRAFEALSMRGVPHSGSARLIFRMSARLGCDAAGDAGIARRVDGLLATERHAEIGGRSDERCGL
jgi:hypothetical protein